MDRVFGYKSCTSGLNNQKHSLLGLLAHAVENDGDITLPLLVNFATDDRGAISEMPFEDIFDIERFLEMAKLQGVGVRVGQSIDNVNFHQMFQIGNRVSRERSDSSRSLSRSFWKNLRPSAPIRRYADSLAQLLFEEKGVQAVLQLRIELDWQNYTKSYMKAVDGEDVTTAYESILTKVSRTLGDSVERIYVTCDETQVPLEEVTRFARDVLNLHLVWKSDLVGNTIGPEELCLKTSIDFETALRSKIFIGTTRSTFANTVCMTKMALEGDSEMQHYIYNMPGDLLGLRRDGGIYADYRDAVR